MTRTRSCVWMARSAGFIYLRCVGSQLQGYWGNTGSLSGGTVPARVWTHVAMTFNGTTLILYVNGVQVASGAASGFSGVPTEMYVGRSPGGGNFINGMIDDLVILSQQIPANEVRAIYESNAPVFAESSRFSFRATPRNLVWADDDGLWMRDTTGNAVFGFYGRRGDGLHLGRGAARSGGYPVWAWLTVHAVGYVGGQTHRIWRNAGGHGGQGLDARRLEYIGYGQ
jgi:hypothetical protein